MSRRYKYSSSSLDDFPLSHCLIIIGIILAVTILWDIICLSTQNIYIATITDKSIKRNSDSDKYLIYTELEDGEILVLENTDELFYGKINSSDIYADLKVGETYTFKVVGFRIPLFSSYQNIIDYKLIEKEEVEQIA